MDDRTARRFRTRLLAVMLAAGLLPLSGGGLVAAFGLSRMLSLSLGSLDPLLERAQVASRDPALARELSQARVDLLQAELARRSPARLAPWGLLGAVAVSAALLAAAAVALGRALSRPVERLAGTRALVDATIDGLLDRDLLRIVKLGLSGQLTVETTVVRRRQLWSGGSSPPRPAISRRPGRKTAVSSSWTVAPCPTPSTSRSSASRSRSASPRIRGPTKSSW